MSWSRKVYVRSVQAKSDNVSCPPFFSVTAWHIDKWSMVLESMKIEVVVEAK